MYLNPISFSYIIIRQFSGNSAPPLFSQYISSLSFGKVTRPRSSLLPPLFHLSLRCGNFMMVEWEGICSLKLTMGLLMALLHQDIWDSKCFLHNTFFFGTEQSEEKSDVVFCKCFSYTSSIFLKSFPNACRLHLEQIVYYSSP